MNDIGISERFRRISGEREKGQRQTVNIIKPTKALNQPKPTRAVINRLQPKLTQARPTQMKTTQLNLNTKVERPSKVLPLSSRLGSKPKLIGERLGKLIHERLGDHILGPKKVLSKVAKAPRKKV